MRGQPVKLKYGNSFLPIPPSDLSLRPIIPPPQKKTKLTPAGIGKRISEPIGSKTLEELHGEADRVLIVVSDATRVTGAEQFLPVIIGKLLKAGVGKDRIRFLFATGVHRKVTDEEKAFLLGKEIFQQFESLDHDPRSESSLSLLGRTSRGTIVRVHSEVLRASRVILTGSVDFHYHAGFTGGRKALIPGLAAHDTAASNHLLSLLPGGKRHPHSDAGILESNPVHEDMLEGALMVPPPFLVNSIVNEGGDIEELFAGDMVQAHQKAAESLKESRRVTAEKKKIVIAGCGGHPKDVNFIQANKSLQNCARLVEDGGVLILVARCPEGHGNPEFARWLALGKERILSEMMVRFKSYAQTALSIIHILERINVILVSDLRSEELSSLGMRRTGSLEEALSLAEGITGRQAGGWVVEHGPRWFFRSP